MRSDEDFCEQSFVRSGAMRSEASLRSLYSSPPLALLSLVKFARQARLNYLLGLQYSNLDHYLVRPTFDYVGVGRLANPKPDADVCSALILEVENFLVAAGDLVGREVSESARLRLELRLC